MKTVATSLLALVCLSTVAGAQTPTPPAKRVDAFDLNNVLVWMPEVGEFVDTGTLAQTIKRYPELSAEIKAEVEAGFDGLDERQTARRLEQVSEANLTIAKKARDKYEKKVQDFTKQKESALLKLMARDPAAAYSKMQEWMNGKLPISQATQAKIMSAYSETLPKPTPTPTPTPTPKPPKASPTPKKK